MTEIFDRLNAGEPVTQELLDNLPLEDGETLDLPIVVVDGVDKAGVQHHDTLVFTKGAVKLVETVQ